MADDDKPAEPEQPNDKNPEPEQPAPAAAEPDDDGPVSRAEFAKAQQEQGLFFAEVRDQLGKLKPAEPEQPKESRAPEPKAKPDPEPKPAPKADPEPKPAPAAAKDGPRPYGSARWFGKRHG